MGRKAWLKWGISFGEAVFYAERREKVAVADIASRYWAGATLEFYEKPKSLPFMPILGITNKYASWPAKVDHEAYSCYFSPDVRMNGGGGP